MKSAEYSAGPSTKSLSSSLSQILVPILLLNRYPRSLIQLSLQTLSLPTTKFSRPYRAFSDSSSTSPESDEPSDVEYESVAERAAIINAAVCALMDAGIGMIGMICATAVAILPASSPPVNDAVKMDIDSSDPIIVLDPTAEEERDAFSTYCIGFSFGQGVGGAEGDMCFLEMGRGSCEEIQVRS